MVKIDCLNTTLNISKDYITNKLSECECEWEISAKVFLTSYTRYLDILQGDMMNDKNSVLYQLKIYTRYERTFILSKREEGKEKVWILLLWGVPSTRTSSSASVLSAEYELMLMMFGVWCCEWEREFVTWCDVEGRRKNENQMKEKYLARIWQEESWEKVNDSFRKPSTYWNKYYICSVDGEKENTRISETWAIWRREDIQCRFWWVVSLHYMSNVCVFFSSILHLQPFRSKSTLEFPQVLYSNFQHKYHEWRNRKSNSQENISNLEIIFILHYIFWLARNSSFTLPLFYLLAIPIFLIWNEEKKIRYLISLLICQ